MTLFQLPATRRTAPSCHGDARGTGTPGAAVVALVGAPNAGKSTLFNALTGGSRTVGNWPGTTVEVGRGTWQPTVSCCAGRLPIDVLDLPGAYSLDAASPDEQLTSDLFEGRLGGSSAAATPAPDLALVVADAAHLARSLYLVAQLREQSRRIVVALTMIDVAERRGTHVDAERLSSALGVPVVVLDPRRRSGREDLEAAVDAALSAPAGATRVRSAELLDESDDLAVADERFGWVEAAFASGAVTEVPAQRTVTDRVDRWVTAPVVGPLVFLLVMWGVFQATTTVATPVQDLLGRLVSGPVTAAGRWLFALVGLSGSWGEGLVLDGLVAGVGMLLTFVPLMAIMFALLALLEDSGYLARAAVVTDRVMRSIGLPGKAFLPLVVGFGCNVPAISATRILPDARHRVMTALLVPFTSCSARLTVYVRVAATCFPRAAGTVVFAMYLTSILFVVVVGLILRRTLWRTVGQEPLVLDLPAYQRPTLRLTAAVTWLRVRAFLRTAGGVIVVTVTAVWLLQAIPVAGRASFGSVAPDDSLFAALAKAIAPVFSLAGFGEWHTVGALVVGFVAKEAVLTSWAQTYATADPAAGLPPDQLQAHIGTAFAHSSGGAVTAAVFAFLVFLLAYTPCVATVAAQRREIGIRWTAFGIGLQLTVAWTVAVTVFQFVRLLA